MFEKLLLPISFVVKFLLEVFKHPLRTSILVIDQSHNPQVYVRQQEGEPSPPITAEEESDEG